MDVVDTITDLPKRTHKSKPFYWACKDAWYINYRDTNGRRRRMRLGSTEAEAYEAYSHVKGTVVMAEPRPNIETVYFAYAPITNKIKIGKSCDPESRLVELQIGSPEKLQIINTLVGPRGLERRLHKRFSSLLSHGEWYHASDDLFMFAYRPFVP